MDKIFLRGLEVRCLIGIRDWERLVPQSVCIDLELETNSRRAAGQDDIEQATDYKSLAKVVIDLVKDSSFQLIESLAEEVARTCLAHPDIGWARVRIAKPGAIRGARDVGIEIERGRSLPSLTEHSVFLGIGSNLAPEESVPRIVDWIRRRFRVIALSPVYQTPASGPEGQPDFLNLVAACETRLDPFGVHAETRAIEDVMGRVRTHDRFEPRPCDIDLLLYDSLVGEHDGLHLPHPQILEETFVFVPLLDVAPDLVHPETRELLREIVAPRLEHHGLQRRTDLRV